ncbi:hypothetical protein JCM17380_35010 [Desulfosporosinus burensis]
MGINWITASEIEAWTSREPRRAQELLPELVWRLLLASCVNMMEHHFPHSKAVQYSGYDGYLDTDTQSVFFPRGKSVWEFGSDQNILSKFNGDYKKRSENPNGIEQSSTTFCFVSSRIWNHQTGIVEITAQKGAEGIWKDVRIIDAISLVMWLEACPAVSAWLSGIMGRDMNGLLSLEDYWINITEHTDPKLNIEFFTCSRKPIVPQIINFFNAGSKQIVLSAESEIEAILVFAAELVSSADPVYMELLSRCIIVQSPLMWDVVCTQFKDAVIIPTFCPQAVISHGRSSYILPTNKYSSINLINKTSNRVAIDAHSTHTFRIALEKLGYDAKTVYSIASDLKRSFPALFRKITTIPYLKVPRWSEIANVLVLIPALLIGAWEENCSGDQEVLKSLSGLEYNEYVRLLHPFIACDDTPLFVVDGSYMCISISEMWDVLWNQFSSDMFQRFKSCVLSVYDVADPAYELPERQWYMAGVLGKKSDYSKQLLQGIIISLIMIVERDDGTGNSFGISSITAECESLVSQTFNQVKTWQDWYTIAPYIPFFVEATPNAVLSVMEKEADIPDSEFWKMFKNPEDVMFGRTFYTHLLWALEKLVWLPRYAGRAVKLLMCFADKGYEYKLSNTPINTLTDIFCFWHPQGIFTQAERNLLLEKILKEYPETSRSLVKALLPQGRHTTTDISKFSWRNVDIPETRVTRGEYRDACAFLAQLFLNNINPCFADWGIVFSSFNAFLSQTDVVIKKCKEQAVDMGADDLLKLCSELAKFIGKHRKFVHSDWSISEEAISKIEELYYSILPETPLKYIHYFDYHFNGLHPLVYKEKEYSLATEREQLKQFQLEKIREALSQYGAESIFIMLPKIENTSTFAEIVTEEVLSNHFVWDYIQQVQKINRNVASAIVSKVYFHYGLGEFISTVPELPAKDAGWLLVCLPLTEELFDLVKSLTNDTQRIYWETMNPWRLDLDNFPFSQQYILKMIEFNRPYTLIDCLAYSSYPDIPTLITILQKALELNPNDEPNGKALSSVPSYDIEEIFKKLYTEADKYSSEIAKLEIAYLLAFDIEFEPKCLVDQVLAQPSLYMELLSAAYESDDMSDSWDNDRQKMARHADDALDRIRRIPGSSHQSEQPDKQVFFKWVEDASLLAENRHYSLAHSICFGTILSYAPIGEDGVWPTECIRDFLERNHSDKLVNYFITGLRNQRGVHSVTGGTEESQIAERYYGYATKLQLLYPRTATIINRIGDSYQYESERERAHELKGRY